MNHRIKKNHQSGFTLAELLIVVAVTMILASVSLVGLIHYRKQVRQREMDNKAQEIFLAAQNRMSAAFANGSLQSLMKDSTDYPQSTEIPSGKNPSDYRVFYYNGIEGGSSNSDALKKLILPANSIDTALSDESNYRIVFDFNTGNIISVYYSENRALTGSPDLACVFTTDGIKDVDKSVFEQLKEGAETRLNFKISGRKYNIGYYPGKDVTISGAEDYKGASLKIDNGERLILTTTADKDSDRDRTFTYTIFGESSGQKAEFKIEEKDFSKNPASGIDEADSEWHTLSVSVSDGSTTTLSVKKTSGAGAANDTFEILLDDLAVNPNYDPLSKSAGTAELNNHFLHLFKGFLPGETVDITLRTAKGAQFGDSNVVSSSNLFADSSMLDVKSASSGTSQGMGTGGTVYLENLRHLENLSELYYGVSETSSCDVYLKSDLDFQQEASKLGVFTALGDLAAHSYIKSEYTDGSFHQLSTFIPITLSYPMDFNGNGKKLSNAVICQASNAGFIGTSAKDLTVKNLALDHFLVYSAGGNAGTLLGTSQGDVHLDGINCTSPAVFAERNTEGGYAGGLIGKACGVSDVLNSDITAPEVASVLDTGGVIGRADPGENHAMTFSRVSVSGDMRIYSEGGTDWDKPATKNKDASTMGSAGGLLGRQESGSLKITSCIVAGDRAVVYSDGRGFKTGEDFHQTTDDSAGGLVGTVTAPQYTYIYSSGSCVYAYAPEGDCAGGLIGDAKRVKSISGVYASGHTTKEAVFENKKAFNYTRPAAAPSLRDAFQNRFNSSGSDPLSALTVTNPGGYNVFAGNAAGGIIGFCATTHILDSMSTNSVCGLNQTGSNSRYSNLGGFIGQSNQVSVKGSYSAGVVFGPDPDKGSLVSLGSFVGDLNKDGDKFENCYCIKGLSYASQYEGAAAVRAFAGSTGHSAPSTKPVPVGSQPGGIQAVSYTDAAVSNVDAATKLGKTNAVRTFDPDTASDNAVKESLKHYPFLFKPESTKTPDVTESLKKGWTSTSLEASKKALVSSFFGDWSKEEPYDENKVTTDGNRLIISYKAEKDSDLLIQLSPGLPKDESQEDPSRAVYYIIKAHDHDKSKQEIWQLQSVNKCFRTSLSKAANQSNDPARMLTYAYDRDNDSTTYLMYLDDLEQYFSIFYRAIGGEKLGKSLIYPGENLFVRVMEVGSKVNNCWNDTFPAEDQEIKKQQYLLGCYNSCFSRITKNSDGDNTYTAEISCLRHLDNLSNFVSFINHPDSPIKITRAVQTADITLNDPTKESEIALKTVGSAENPATVKSILEANEGSYPFNQSYAYNAGGKVQGDQTIKSAQTGANANISKCFSQIKNSDLLEYNGGNHSLINFRMASDGYGEVMEGFGLFYGVGYNNDTRELTIHDLTMVDPVVQNSNNTSGGVIVGKIWEKASVTLDHVNIQLTKPEADGKYRLVDTGNFGCFVGTNEGSLIVSDCQITSGAGTVLSVELRDGAAGGIVGVSSGSLTASNVKLQTSMAMQSNKPLGSFVGQLSGTASLSSCSIEGESITMDMTGGGLGGVVGEISGDGEVSFTGCTLGTTGAVSLTNNQDIGGFVGSISGKGKRSFTDCSITDYTLSLTGDGHGIGEFIGRVSSPALELNNCTVTSTSTALKTNGAQSVHTSKEGRSTGIGQESGVTITGSVTVTPENPTFSGSFNMQ